MININPLREVNVIINYLPESSVLEPLLDDQRDWLELTNRFFNMFKFSKDDIELFIKSLEGKVEKALNRDGINGVDWEFMLTEHERFLATYSHLRCLTNSGFKGYLELLKEHLAPEYSLPN